MQVKSQPIDPNKFDFSKYSREAPTIDTSASILAQQTTDDKSRGSKASIQEAAEAGLRAASFSEMGEEKPSVKHCAEKQTGNGTTVRVGDVLKHKKYGFIGEIQEVQKEGIIIEAAGIGRAFVDSKESRNYKLVARGV